MLQQPALAGACIAANLPTLATVMLPTHTHRRMQFLDCHLPASAHTQYGVVALWYGIRLAVRGPDLQTISRQSYDNAKVTIDL